MTILRIGIDMFNNKFVFFAKIINTVKRKCAYYFFCRMAYGYRHRESFCLKPSLSFQKEIVIDLLQFNNYLHFFPLLHSYIQTLISTWMMKQVQGISSSKNYDLRLFLLHSRSERKIIFLQNRRTWKSMYSLILFN